MKTKLCLLALCLWTSALAATAQNLTISGTVVDNQSGEPVEMVTLRLMKQDSTFVTGASTDEKGQFKVQAKKAGEYIVKFSFLGYHPVYKNVQLTKDKPEANLGTVKMQTDDVVLKGATVQAHLAKLEMHKDTFIYNVAAYRVPEGATLEALVEKLPGAVVDDDGGITLNGKTVSEILVDGKDFFKGDTKVAMKNLPVSLINRVKSYDKKSDYTQETGIDDGNDKTVLDLEMKKKLKSTWFSNLDLAYGNHDRYSSNLFVNRFTDNTRFSAYGSMNNVGDQHFRGGGPGFRGGGGGGGGLRASKSFGADGFWNNGKKEWDGGFFQLGGNLRVNFGNSDSKSRSNSETFLNAGSGGAFNNNDSHSYSHSSSVSGEVNLRWRPDSMTTLRIRPNFSHSESNGSSASRSAQFNADPYDVVSNPLDSMFLSNDALNVQPALAAIAVNRNQRQSKTDSDNDRVSVDLGLTRRLNSKGRSISLDGDLAYSKSHSHSFNISDIYYYQQRGGRSQTYYNQYSTSPSKSWNYTARLSYTEPIVKNLFFQGSYDYSYRYSDQDRSLYQLDSLATWGLGNLHPLGSLPDGDSLNLALNMENSRYATYKDQVHNINLGIRYSTENINFSAGIRLEPQRTKLDYQKNQLDTTVTRTVFNLAPNVRLRYTPSRYSRLELRYRGSSSQPSMTDLLDVTDSSDPLNISKGNPGLKPSWTNNFNAYFNIYQQEHQRSYSADLSFSQTSNSISNAVTYNELTGVRTSQPENINGNWNTSGSFMFNTALGSDNAFNISSHTSSGFQHRVGYISTGLSNSQRNTMKTLTLGENMMASYRNDFYEIGLNGSIHYDHSRSSLQKQSNLDTYTFAYGVNYQWNTTWNMSLSTNIAMNSRRGFNDASMNTNELIWNAQISQSFLQGNAATLSLQLFDILHQQSSISRTINSIMRSDSWSNGIHSYFMLHFIYRLNIIGGIGGRIGGSGGGRRGGDGGSQGGMRGGRSGGGGMGR